ncbi:hypothetical protein VPHD239_0139 [Vibrio phage D239]
MFRIEIVGVMDVQTLDLSPLEISELFNQRTRVHSRAPGFVNILRKYGEHITDYLKQDFVQLDDPEVVAYFEINRVFHQGGSVVFHND